MDHLTRQPKDILTKLALELEYDDIINYCKVSKRITEKVCDNKQFWIAKLKRDFDQNYDISFSIESLKNDYKAYMEEPYYLKLKSILTKDYKLIDDLIKKGYTFSIPLISRATRKGDISLIKRLNIRKNTSNRNYGWDTVLRVAAYEGFKDLMELAISQGGDIWNRSMHAAAEGNHKELVDFLIEKGANDWNMGMEGAILANNMDMINFFIQKGANNWVSGMKHAASIGNKELVDFFIQKGVKPECFIIARAQAYNSGHKELANYIQEKEKKLLGENH